MSEPARDWLAARETADARSRTTELATAFAAVVGPDDLVVDLGCGTGANFRFLDHYLAPDQKWLGIDNDSEVLSRAAAQLPRTRVSLASVNLATDLPRIPSDRGVAITASAFLDTTSRDWLTQLAKHCCDTPLLIAMSAAGQPEWYPVDELDESIRSTIESYQRYDYGFGPSLGPDAVQFLAEQLRDLGCQVSVLASDWNLGPSDHRLMAMMIGGVARRVKTMQNAEDAQKWEKTRRDQLQLEELRLVVKHLELLSIPRALSSF